MSLSAEDRASFVGLLPKLGPEADASSVLRWAVERREALLSELGEVPGADRVRVGVLRLLPALVPDEASRAPLLASVDEALTAFDDDPLDGVGALRRHPAWVGLCAVELAVLRGAPASTGYARAVRLAARGFARTSPEMARGEGELLWALAEAAGDVGWDDHVDGLLAAAAGAAFDDAENLGRLRLVQVLRALDADAPQVDAALDVLLASAPLDAQTHAHALWIGALRDREAGRIGRALERLEAADALLDDEEDEEARTRIGSLIAALRGGGGCAEA